MKLLYLNPSSQMGGAERVLVDILASLRAAQPDWSLHLVVPGEGPLADKATALGVNVKVLPFPSSLARIGDAGVGGPAGHQVSRVALMKGLLSAAPAVISYLKKLRRIIRELEPDVIHTNGFKMHILGVWGRTEHVPVVWHIHDYVRSRPVMARLLRLFRHRCAVIIANSKSVAEDVQAICQGVPEVKIIYNAIDLKNFSPDGPRLDLDTLSGLPPAPPETIKVGMLATLARWKGHEIFLKALTLLPEDLPVRGYIATGAIYQTAGSQYSVDELKALINDLGLSQRVGLTGFVDQAASAMRALDIVVHASTQPEPFGLVIAEGMACGKAVIASNAGGAAELIQAEGNAIAHPPGDAESLARHITQLASSAELRVRLGTRARLTAERSFNRTRLAGQLIPIYQSANKSLINT